MFPATVTLTEHFQNLAKKAAVLTFNSSQTLQDQRGRNGKLYTDELESRGAECALALVFQVLAAPDSRLSSAISTRAPSVNTFKSVPDVIGTEVKYTRSHSNRLLISQRDNSILSQPFVLVTGSFSQYVVRGWITGTSAVQPKYFTDAGTGRTPAWFIPQNELNTDVTSLVEINEAYLGSLNATTRVR